MGRSPPSVFLGMRGTVTRANCAFPECAEDCQALVVEDAEMADVEAVGRFGRAVLGGGAELRKSKRRERVALRVGADRAGDECVGVMREIVAAPMLGPSLGVVRD